MSPIGNSFQWSVLQNIHPMNTGNQALWSPHLLWPRHSCAFSLSKEHAELQQAPKTENKSPYNLCFYMCGLQCPPLCCDEWRKPFKPQETGTQRCLCDNHTYISHWRHGENIRLLPARSVVSEILTQATSVIPKAPTSFRYILSAAKHLITFISSWVKRCGHYQEPVLLSAASAKPGTLIIGVFYNLQQWLSNFQDFHLKPLEHTLVSVYSVRGNG